MRNAFPHVKNVTIPKKVFHLKIQGDLDLILATAKIKLIRLVPMLVSRSFKSYNSCIEHFSIVLFEMM